MTATTTSTTAAIELRDVAHRYRGGDGSMLALAGVNIDVREGEFVSLVGPSGCGKTTLLRAVAGLLSPTDGEVRVLGGTPGQAQRSHALGLVSQDPGLLPWLTVEGNVRVPLGITRRTADVPALLERVGIARFARYRPHELSGGMRQRVALARALAHGPRLLLMDEPFGALDELSREAMRLELLEIWDRERISVLFVTHSIREAVLLSDRVLVMSGSPGRIRDDVPVTLPRPRFREMEEEPDFIALVRRVRAGLEAPMPGEHAGQDARNGAAAHG